MEFQTQPYIVYVRQNAGGYITAINSSAFLPDTDGWVEIDRGYGDKYHHAQGNYFPQPIYTESGVCRYKLENGKTVGCTAEEIARQEAALVPAEPVPTLESRVEALEQAFETSILALDAEYQKGVNSL